MTATDECLCANNVRFTVRAFICNYSCLFLFLFFDRYENRPSREEDVHRIRKLEADAIESRSVAVRAREEMAFFKRELLNREENYNKKFNVNPVVGVMQVRACWFGPPICRYSFCCVSPGLPTADKIKEGS